MTSVARITHVAIRFEGKVWSLPAPNRHHHILWKILKETNAEYVDARGEDQGFLDETGQYLNREEALIRVQKTNQIKPGTVIRCGMLFSEDIW